MKRSMMPWSLILAAFLFLASPVIVSGGPQTVWDKIAEQSPSMEKPGLISKSSGEATDKLREHTDKNVQTNPSKEVGTMSKQEALKAAFIFIAPEGDPVKHRSWVKTPQVELVAIAVKDYEAAERLSQELVAAGIQAIELCGGFGNVGTAKVVEAVKAQIPVGVVRFDLHPGLGFKSGDAIFSK